jgi:glycosyltransferase involved in cell wall biosynthesis
MTWSAAAVGKVRSAISKYGLSAGIQDSLARWGQSRLKVPQDVLGDYGWILNQEHAATLPPPDSGPLKINWLIPGVVAGSGGFMDILRTAYHLERWGHQQRFYMVGKTTLNAMQATEFLRNHYSDFPIKAQVEIFTGRVSDSDALVATHWNTAYAARGLGNTARKFYFVQDVESLFYPEGSFCEFVKQTYRWGFHGITLGPWIAKVLQSEFGMICSPFGFSYDREIYSPYGKRYLPDRKNRVLFYARPTTERRGFELGILALSLVAMKIPDTEFVLVGFPARFMHLPFRAVLPGVLSPSELASLYRSCSLALVLSHTNVSLLPLELMGCDCPVVSNTGPNVEWLLTEKATQLANSDPEALADAIISLLENEELRAQKIAAGRDLAQSTDWVSEIKTIESAIYAGLRESAETRVGAGAASYSGMQAHESRRPTLTLE